MKKLSEGGDLERSFHVPKHSTSHSAEEHKRQSPKKLKIAIITVSSSRYRDKTLKDESGEIAV